MTTQKISDIVDITDFYLLVSEDQTKRNKENSDRKLRYFIESEKRSRKMEKEADEERIRQDNLREYIQEKCYHAPDFPVFGRLFSGL